MRPRPMLLDLPTFREENGLLVVPSEISPTFDLKRVFFVHARSGDVRGQHAHLECSQLLVCASGAVAVRATNGDADFTFELRDASQGLLVPPRVWCEQQYLDDPSVLLVLCDRPYLEDDYVRDREAFMHLVHETAE